MKDRAQKLQRMLAEQETLLASASTRHKKAVAKKNVRYYQSLIAEYRERVRQHSIAIYNTELVIDGIYSYDLDDVTDKQLTSHVNKLLAIHACYVRKFLPSQSEPTFDYYVQQGHFRIVAGRWTPYCYSMTQKIRKIA